MLTLLLNAEVYDPRPLGRRHLLVAADADLVVLGEDASVRHVMALGRWHVLDGEVMIGPTIQEAHG